jgi:hypothetical protein
VIQERILRHLLKRRCTTLYYSGAEIEFARGSTLGHQLKYHGRLVVAARCSCTPGFQISHQSYNAHCWYCRTYFRKENITQIFLEIQIIL